MEVEMVDFQPGQPGDGRACLGYFCHKCSVEIDPKMPGFTCPRCDSGFIEELSDNLQRDRQATNGTVTPNVTDQILMDLLTSQPPRSRYDNGDDDDDDIVASLPRPHSNSISSLGASRRRSHQESHQEERAQLPLHSFIESVLDSLRDDSYQRFGTDFSEPRLRRYGRDLHRSYGGLEDLFTQILTQLTASGPEPASQEQIDELLVEKIKGHHLENSMQCSICLEKFSEGEEVTSLPCDHLHHKLCIIPWLQLHATCPVCRHCLSSASPEPAFAARPPFYFTEQNSPDPVELRTTLEAPGNVPVNVSVQSPWDTTRLAALMDDADSDDYADIPATRRSHPASTVLSPDIEMVAMDNNNVAMETEFGGRYETRRPVSESFLASSEISGTPPTGSLVCLGDVEVTGVESESDL